MKVNQRHRFDHMLIELNNGTKIEYDWCDWSAYEITDNLLIVYDDDNNNGVTAVYTMNNVMRVKTIV